MQSLDGQLHYAGDAHTPFSIQSISKVFSLVQAINHSGEDIWSRLGYEPSGQAFNSLVQLEVEKGRPRNPFINAGALVICDINQSRYATPTLSMRDFVRRLSANPASSATRWWPSPSTSTVRAMPPWPT